MTCLFSKIRTKLQTKVVYESVRLCLHFLNTMEVQVLNFIPRNITQCPIRQKPCYEVKNKCPDRNLLILNFWM